MGATNQTKKDYNNMPTTGASTTVTDEEIYFEIFSRVQTGKLTQKDLLWFLSLSRRELDNLSSVPRPKPLAPVEPAEKFVLLADLGILTVPDDYDHATLLTKFWERNHREFYYFSRKITDQNFANPTRVLSPGNKLRVRAFKQVINGTTTSEERMAFLATQKAIYTGAQGISLVFEEMRHQLHKGVQYTSFDGKCTDDHYNVPLMLCTSDGEFWFDIGSFKRVYGLSDAFLCFTEVE